MPAQRHQSELDVARGQKLKVTGSAAKQTTAKSSTAATGSKTATGDNGGGSGKTYTVRSGDTLYSIAKRNGTTVKRLCQLNGLSENSKLKVGQKIKLG